jgi:hypothetical protein
MLEAMDGRKQAHMEVLVAVFGYPVPTSQARPIRRPENRYAESDYQAHNDNR